MYFSLPFYACFNIIIHFSREEHTCKDFRCSTKEFCISPDLLCDNVNHCEDGSDEAIGSLCEGNFYSLNCHPLPPLPLSSLKWNEGEFMMMS